MTNSGGIRCKVKRSQVYHREKIEKKRAKKKARDLRSKEAELLGNDAPKKQKPKTLDNSREEDKTVVEPTDDEIQGDEAYDEFCKYFEGKTPRILLTSGTRPSKTLNVFMKELLYVFPRYCTFYQRMGYDIKKIMEFATSKGFTAIMLINENRNVPNQMYLIHLPEGPTMHFTLSNVLTRRNIPNTCRATLHPAELILNNFTTRLGLRVARSLASLFPQNPDFHGRRVVTLHNQRDFIFFRHHRYMIEGTKRAELQEIGPRFTMKLISIQKGAMDTQFGEYEWEHKKDMDTSRKKFFL
eukprot:c1081_g1_i1.p1 GENE.c1081_g1_i1~~c1081_g1_i1.p1  ORF type:complete len:313 (-),score=44.77 c1081_g1_i1:110-1003(-)